LKSGFMVHEHEELYEHLTITHILCFLVLMLGIILGKNIHTIDIIKFDIKFFLLVSSVGLSLVVMYNFRSFLQERNSRFLSWFNFCYLSFPLLIVVLTLFLVRDHTYSIEIILILPVLIVSSMMGKPAGMAISTICSLILIYFHKTLEPELSFYQLLEFSLIMISVMFLVGWFVGGLTSIEAKQRERLNQSLLSLKNEIVHREKMENEMARLDRLNLVGEMAASIGHEVRNPMTTVRGFLQLLSGKKDCLQYKEYFDLMIDELDRANSIITEYLSLAKNKPIDLKTNNLNSIIQAIQPLIQADALKCDQHIKIDLNETTDLLMDEKEVRQVILNLARNGFEAMSPGGMLTIKTFKEGGEVVLAVQDQGKGIDPGSLDKIGTPFFTTKDFGTGLGLAVCYSIAARHNAVVDIETSSGGTTFYIRFKIPHERPVAV